MSKEFDLTQEELATALGVSRHTIISIEKGGNTTAEMVLKLGHFFDKDPREIFLFEMLHIAYNNVKNKPYKQGGSYESITCNL